MSNAVPSPFRSSVAFNIAPEMPAGDDDATARPHQHTRLRSCIFFVMGILLALVVFDSMKEKRIERTAASFFTWIESHPFLGVLAVILVYTAATICFVPGSVLTIGTGFAFRSAFDDFGKGLALSSLAVFVGASCGSVCSFLLGRYLFREWVVRLASSYPIFRAIDRALENNGLKIMVLLRLSPLIPYNALDYISGVTSISLFSYSVALVGLLPGTITFCAIGATASSLAEGTDRSENGGLRVFALVFGLIFAFLGAGVASFYSKIELDMILQDESEGTVPIVAPDSEEEQYVRHAGRFSDHPIEEGIV
ncbi:predicted protein [Phaeodactylum tricornutum CCAP 1055/1]|uniref:VTT domain-containing protein n=1 Tax=Phaeodactylum tricornutum (strain CCAP 1055/1) TaxID=556484 RepID=B7FYH8_PHATC|nr:predicted protein [Phaeodactylum tricornutum CCAP 1055/1]EEC48922.1 predicted protein [Phaeodactylum tricornutum CCAP 1055/1]|eukprot:XP_002179936.1 predicted protein [Phaeodactylum tricornutum CCAP 1055/1]